MRPAHSGWAEWWVYGAGRTERGTLRSARGAEGMDRVHDRSGAPCPLQGRGARLGWTLRAQGRAHRTVGTERSALLGAHGAERAERVCMNRNTQGGVHGAERRGATQVCMGRSALGRAQGGGRAHRAEGTGWAHGVERPGPAGTQYVACAPPCAARAQGGARRPAR